MVSTFRLHNGFPNLTSVNETQAQQHEMSPLHMFPRLQHHVLESMVIQRIPMYDALGKTTVPLGAHASTAQASSIVVPFTVNETSVHVQASSPLSSTHCEAINMQYSQAPCHTDHRVQLAAYISHSFYPAAPETKIDILSYTIHQLMHSVRGMVQDPCLANTTCRSQCSRVPWCLLAPCWLDGVGRVLSCAAVLSNWPADTAAT
jgi:hypothetical protein